MKTNQPMVCFLVGSLTAAFLLPGCASLTDEQRAEIATQMNKQSEYYKQQAQRSNEEVRTIMARPVPKIDVPPLTTSNGLQQPNPTRSPVPRPGDLPSSVGGIPTGRTQISTDGTTFYEMKSAGSGAVYWTSVKPY
jgi:hypothetical protein